MRRKKQGSTPKQNYYLPQSQLEELLKSIGVVIDGCTSTDIIAFCPLHANRDSPAFNISLGPGHLWRCHSGKCGKKGNLITLLTYKGYTYSEAMKMVKNGVMQIDDLQAFVQDIFKKSEPDTSVNEWVKIDVGEFAESDAKHNYPARTYAESRGISREAYEFFQLGYSASKKMLVIPVFTPRNELCGVIGRQIESKRYQYSTGLTRGKLIWNLNSAKYHDAIILTEGALDSIYIWQQGYHNVGAVLGSAISPMQMKQILQYHTEIICFFDNDDAGNALRDQLMETVKEVSVSFVTYPDRVIDLPPVDGQRRTRPIKDPGDLTGDEIKAMIENRKTNVDMLLQDICDSV